MSTKTTDLDCRNQEKLLAGTRTSPMRSILRVKCSLKGLSRIPLPSGTLLSLYIVSRASVSFLHMMTHFKAIQRKANKLFPPWPS